MKTCSKVDLVFKQKLLRLLLFCFSDIIPDKKYEDICEVISFYCCCYY